MDSPSLNFLNFFRKGAQTLDFMNAVNTHTQVLENGIRELRYDLTANPLRNTIDVGTEAILLSGLRDRCSRSINHIQKLHEEARFLKNHLEKMEAKAYFDFETQGKSKYPSLFRRALFVSSVIFLGGFIYRQIDPQDFELKINLFKEKAYLIIPYLETIVQFITVNGKMKTAIPITLVSE